MLQNHRVNIDEEVDMWDTEQVDPTSFYSDLLDFLQVLSPSNHVLYCSTALQTLHGEDLNLVTNAYQVRLRTPRQHSIQVIGPPSHGKVTLVKSLIQKVMCYSPNSLLLETLLDPLGMARLDLRTLLQSFVHQIISQRPTLFFHVRPLYLEQRKSHRTTTQDVLWTFFYILLRVSHDWKIIVGASNVHLWPRTVQSSLTTLERYLQSLNCNYLFVTSSATKLPDLCSASLQVLDLGRSDSHRRSMIQAKVKAVLFSQPSLQAKALAAHFQDIQIPQLVSLTNADRYAKVLSRNFLLSTPEAVSQGLSDCPRTEDEISRHCLSTLNDSLWDWSRSAISWVHKAVRPLRTSEIAVAIALGNGEIKRSDSIQQISASIEADIERHLGVLLKVDNDLVRFYSAETRRFLTQTPPGTQGIRIWPLLTHEQLVKVCLQFISDVVLKESKETCLAQVTWRHQVQKHCPQTELEFLDYAVRYWPIHYHNHLEQSVERPGQNEEQLPQSESSRPKVEQLFVNSQTSVNQFLAHSSASHEPSWQTGDARSTVFSFMTHENENARKMWYRLFCLKSMPEENISDDISPLEIATELGLFSIVERILSANTAKENLVDLENLLCTAVKNGRSDLVDLFCDKGARRDNAILEAAGLGRVDYLEKLLPNRERHHIQPGLIASALHRAAQAGSLLTVQFFDKAGPNENNTSAVNLDWAWTDPEQRTILHAAATSGKVEILSHIMMGRTLDLNAKEKSGKSALMVATQLNHALFVKALCDKGADTTLEDEDGKTALHHAIIKDPGIVKVLLEHNANPVKPDKRKQTPLHLACRLGSLEIVEDLVEPLMETDSMNVRNEDDEAPLHIAAECGHSAIVTLLLNKGTDTSAEHDDIQKAIELATASGHLKVFKVLHARSDVSRFANENLIFQSALKGQLLIMQHLLDDYNLTTNFRGRENGDTPLGVAAANGYTEVVHLLLRKGADPNLDNYDRRTPLHEAAVGGHADVATILLSNGADPNALDFERRAPLHQAALYGMTEVVETLLDHNANVNARTLMRDTPLHLSVKHPHIVEILCKQHPQLTSWNYGGLTPLHLAIKAKNLETVELLIKEDSNSIDAPDEDSVTPLHQSMGVEYWKAEIFEALWRQGPDLQHPSYRHKPLMIHAVRVENLEVIRFLIAHDPSLAAYRDTSGNSALHIAVQGNNLEILDELLKIPNGLGVNTTTEEGKSLLHAAADLGLTSIVEKLLEFDVEIDVVDNGEWTPLCWACWNRRIATVECLLRAGANASIRDSFHRSLLHLAADSAPILGILLSHKIEVDAVDSNGWTPLMRAVFYEDENSVRTLVEGGASINLANQEGQTALHIAEKEQNPRLSELLLEASANVTLTDELGKTPLHYTAIYCPGVQGADMVWQLLEREAAVNCKDNDGKTPLHYSAIGDWEETWVIKALIKGYRKRDYNIDEKDHQGCTALHRALALGGHDAAILLISEGASLEERDGESRSCLALAVASARDRQKKVEELLKAKNKRDKSLWTREDMVAAFMATFDDLDTAKTLAKHDGGIFQHQSDAFTILEYCLDSGMDEVAVAFLRLGANPFRHKKGKFSALQICSQTSQSRTVFLNACRDILKGSLPDPEDEFEVLRTSIEHGWTDVYKKIRAQQPPIPRAQIADTDGWAIEHYLYQNNGMNSIERIDAPRAMGILTPRHLIIPDSWRANVRSDDFNLLPDSNKIEYLRKCHKRSNPTFCLTFEFHNTLGKRH